MNPSNRAAAERLARPLRILCCSGSLEGGGSERQLWQLVCKLDRQYFQPSVYLLYRRGVYLERLPADVAVSAFWGPHNEQRRFWPTQIYHQQVAQLTRQLTEQHIDLLYDRTFHMTLVSGAATLKYKIPRVSVIVSPPSQDFARSRERFRYWKKWKLARAYRQPGATTIAVSQEVADDAARYYKLDRQRIVVLPNPVDFDAVRQAANEVIEEKSPVDSSDKLRMVVVGRLSHEKGQRTALRALQLANLQTGPKWHLDLVGDGPDRAELETLAKELGIAKDVSFVGFQNNPHPYMRRATLVCIPSLYEGLPNVALEAMALNCGVVASDCSESLRRLVGQNERGQLAPVGDSAAIAKAMATRLQQTEVWEKRCRQAETWVREQHAIGPWLEEMQRIFLISVK